MLEVIGFIFLIAIMGAASIFGGLIAFNSLGKYNIGGVPNKPYHKIGALLYIMIVMYLWYILFMISPFAVVMV